MYKTGLQAYSCTIMHRTTHKTSQNRKTFSQITLQNCANGVLATRKNNHHGKLISPPQTGACTPVVSVQEVGNPRATLTARYANACASSISPSSPTASTGRTEQSNTSASPAIKTGFNRPPPVTKTRSGGVGQWVIPWATEPTIIAVSVAAASPSDRSWTRAGNAEKSSRSRDFGGFFAK